MLAIGGGWSSWLCLGSMTIIGNVPIVYSIAEVSCWSSFVVFGGYTVTAGVIGSAGLRAAWSSVDELTGLWSISAVCG